MNITCDFHYDAAHRLPNVAPGHKCGRLHGHTYQLTVVVGGEVDPHTGWIVDFAYIKAAVNKFMPTVDHHYLNDINDNPTVENQLIDWWEALTPDLPGLVELQLREGMSNAAIYRGPDA